MRQLSVALQKPTAGPEALHVSRFVAMRAIAIY